MSKLCLASTAAIYTGLVAAAGGALGEVIVAAVGAKVLANTNHAAFQNGPGENKVLSAVQVAAAGGAVVYGSIGAVYGFFKAVTYEEGQKSNLRTNRLAIALTPVMIGISIIADMIGYSMLINNTATLADELSLGNNVAALITGHGVITASAAGLALCLVCIMCGLACCSSNDKTELPVIKRRNHDTNSNTLVIASTPQEQDSSQSSTSSDNDMHSAFSEDDDYIDVVMGNSSMQGVV